MTDFQKFSDEELVAYLDGEAERKSILEIEAAIESDPNLRPRLDALAISKEDISGAFETLLTRAPEGPDIDTLSQVDPAGNEVSGASRLTWRHAAGIAFIALVLGVFASNLIFENRDQSWRSYVAAYQALYGKVTLAHIEQGAGEAAAELERVGGSIGKTITLSAMQSFYQLDYKRSQVLVFQDRPLVQMTFLSKTGEPIALCVMRGSKSAQSEIRYDKMEQMQSASWSSGGYDYFLIGSDDAGLIQAAAEHFSTKL